jgi:hypothetical protein
MTNTPRYGRCHPATHLSTSDEHCLSDATEFVEIHEHRSDHQVVSLLRVCGAHAARAEALPGFVFRQPLSSGVWERIRVGMLAGVFVRGETDPSPIPGKA